jgi:hypothetical protein
VQELLLDGTISRRDRATVTRALDGFHDMMEQDESVRIDDQKVAARQAIEREIEAARLGYARVCFATKNDLGRGPNIVRSVLNPRSTNQSGVNHLKQLYFNRTLKQYSRESSFHISMMVRRKAIKCEALATDIRKEDYPQIQWADDLKGVIRSANGPLALVSDGNHRATACEQLGAVVLAKYLTLKVQLAAMSTAASNSEQGIVYRQTVENCERRLLKMCSWHCVVYDWGGFLFYGPRRNDTDGTSTCFADAIELSPCSDAILLMLSENDVFFNQPDNNTDALHLLLSRMAGLSSTEVDTVLKVHRQARTKVTTRESIFKDKPALMVYSMPYMFHGLKETRLYRPSYMHYWQMCAADLIAPYLTLMVQIMLWLASPQKIDLKAANTIDLVHEQVFYSFQELRSILDTSLLDAEFFQILENAYMDHLKDAMVTFAQEDDEHAFDPSDTLATPDLDDNKRPIPRERTSDVELVWSKAFPGYIKDVCERVEAWVKPKMQQTEDMDTRAALHMLVPKMKFLYDHKMLSDHPSMPQTKQIAFVPFLTLLGINDLAKQLADVTPGILWVRGRPNSTVVSTTDISSAAQLV